MRLISRFWLGEILLNTTKNIVQRLDSIIQWNFAKIYTLDSDLSGGKTESWKRRDNIRTKHSLFIALLSRPSFELQLRPS